MGTSARLLVRDRPAQAALQAGAETAARLGLVQRSMASVWLRRRRRPEFLQHRGALYLRIYFQRNPRNVLGLVFLDATHSLVWRLIQGRTPITERGRRFIARGAQWVGIKRLPFSMRRANAAPWSTLPAESRREVERVAGETIPAITESDEHAMLALASKQADACGNLGDTPLLVITSGMRTAEELRYATDPDAFMETWMLLQKDLVSLSSRGIHRVIADAGHCNLVTDKQYADQVCAEIVAFASFIGLENLRT